MIAVRDRGDATAFETLAFRWDQRLVKYLTKLTGDVQVACDLRQETLIRVWRSASTYDDSYAFATWVTRIATNLARTHVARRQILNSRIATLDGAAGLHFSGESSALNRAIESEQSITLRETLDTLPAPEKELLLMRFQLGLTYGEIALVTATPESTVKSRMSALLRRLRKQMEESGLTRSCIKL